MEEVIKKAILGDKKALESLVLSAKDMVYNLSLRMLLFPEDAQDASQDILIRVVTHLSTFKGKSSFSTWVYRIASNYLIDYKRKSNSFKAMDFAEYEKFIDSGHAKSIAFTQNAGEIKLLEEEVKVSCTHGLLLCLDGPHRLAYIMGEILDLNSREASEILEISPENFRKRLSRSRNKIRNFLNKKCGLADPGNPCRCSKKVDFLIGNKSIYPLNLRFAKQSKRSIDLLEKIDEVQKSVAIYRSVPNFQAPEKLVRAVKQTIKILDYE